MIVFIVWLLVTGRAGGWFGQCGMALILGGAAGNVLDRLLRHSVTDFIDFHIGNYHWYTFNIADSAIVVGAGLVMLELFRDGRHPTPGARLASNYASRFSFNSARSRFTPTACWRPPECSWTLVRVSAGAVARASIPRKCGISASTAFSSALVVAKVWLILSAWDYYVANPARDFQPPNVSIRREHFTAVFSAALLGDFLYTRFEKMPVLAVLDVCAAPVALGHAIGRLGCFAAGCCYGKPTTLPWGVTFTNPIAARISGTPLNVLSIRRSSTNPPPNS